VFVHIERNDDGHHMKHRMARKDYLSGKRVLQNNYQKSTIASVIDNLDAYNGGRFGLRAS